MRFRSFPRTSSHRLPKRNPPLANATRDHRAESSDPVEQPSGKRGFGYTTKMYKCRHGGTLGRSVRMAPFKQAGIHQLRSASPIRVTAVPVAWPSGAGRRPQGFHFQATGTDLGDPDAHKEAEIDHWRPLMERKINSSRRT